MYKYCTASQEVLYRHGRSIQPLRAGKLDTVCQIQNAPDRQLSNFCPEPDLELELELGPQHPASQYSSTAFEIRSLHTVHSAGVACISPDDRA